MKVRKRRCFQFTVANPCVRRFEKADLLRGCHSRPSIGQHECRYHHPMTHRQMPLRCSERAIRLVSLVGWDKACRHRASPGEGSTHPDEHDRIVANSCSASKKMAAASAGLPCCSTISNERWCRSNPGPTNRSQAPSRETERSVASRTTCTRWKQIESAREQKWRWWQPVGRRRRKVDRPLAFYSSLRALCPSCASGHAMGNSECPGFMESPEKSLPAIPCILHPVRFQSPRRCPQLPTHPLRYFIVLVLSIAVLVLDRTIPHARGPLGQACEHRY